MPRPKFEPGREKTGGKQKGTSNKFTNLKQAFLDVFERIEEEGKKEGSKVRGLFEFATKSDRNQAIFYQMTSKMLPSNITLDGDMNVTYLVSEKFLPKGKDKEDNADV